MTEEDIDKAWTGLINLDSLVCHSCSNVAEYREYKRYLFDIKQILVEAKNKLTEKSSD